MTDLTIQKILKMADEYEFNNDSYDFVYPAELLKAIDELRSEYQDNK